MEGKTHSQKDRIKTQRAMYQIKEQDKTSEKQLNEVEIGNLPEKEFRKMIVKMIRTSVHKENANSHKRGNRQ